MSTVVTTHPDAHSMGNLNLFPCAEVCLDHLFSAYPIFALRFNSDPFRHRHFSCQYSPASVGPFICNLFNLFAFSSVFGGGGNLKFWFVYPKFFKFALFSLQKENNRSELPFRPVSDHADLYLTPGISLQDQSLVVRGVKGHGTVAIVGEWREWGERGWHGTEWAKCKWHNKKGSWC